MRSDFQGSKPDDGTVETSMPGELAATQKKLTPVVSTPSKLVPSKSAELRISTKPDDAAFSDASSLVLFYVNIHQYGHGYVSVLRCVLRWCVLGVY